AEAEVALGAGFAEIERVEQIFSVFRSESEVSLVNREASDQAVPVSKEFFRLTKYAIASSEYSLNSFDISIGRLIHAWSLRGGSPRLPSRSELREALSLVGSKQLVLDEKNRTIRFSRRGMNLDFGGLAKGYAAERAARIAGNGGAISAL